MLRQRGKDVPQIAWHALRDELLILPGAAMSPINIVRALERFIEIIKSQGMYVGMYKGKLIREGLNGYPFEAI
jgi:hypothetical protein